MGRGCKSLKRNSKTTEIRVHNSNGNLSFVPVWLNSADGKQFKCSKFTTEYGIPLPIIEDSTTTYLYNVNVEKLSYTVSGKYRDTGNQRTFWDHGAEKFNPRTITAVPPRFCVIVGESLTYEETRDVIIRNEYSSLYSLPFKRVDRMNLVAEGFDLPDETWDQTVMVDAIAKIHGDDVFQQVKHLTVHDQTVWNRILEYGAPKVEYLKIELLKEGVKSKIPNTIKTLHVRDVFLSALSSDLLGDFFVDTIIVGSCIDARSTTNLLGCCRRLVIECDRSKINYDGTFHDRSGFNITILSADHVTAKVVTYRVCKASGADPEDCYDFNFTVEKNK